MDVKRLEVGKDVLLGDFYEYSKAYKNKNYRNIVSGIYILKNIVNGMTYVGCSKDIYKRIKIHKTAIKKKKLPIYIALNEYGIENFCLNIIEICDKKSLMSREIFWIKETNSKAPNGYNLTDGGRGSLGRIPSDKAVAHLIKRNKGRVVTQKERDTHGAIMKKKWAEPAYRDINSGKNNHGYGKHRSKEVREKISKYHKNNISPNAKRVDMIDKETNKILLCFSSLANVALMLDITTSRQGKKYNSTAIGNACSGKTKTSHGYKWQYNNEGNEQYGK